MNTVKLKQLLESFLMEDIGEGDITSNAIFPQTMQGKGILLAKEDGVISGLDIIRILYRILAPEIRVETFVEDGEQVKNGDVIAGISGPVRAILAGERTALNLLQRMSGISTMTKRCIDILNDSSISICDTRKTAPGLRMLDKYAVVCGGGKNHRFGLYDGVMIKDNHIAYCGSITKAVEAVRETAGHMVKIEVETETEEEVIEAVNAGADIIMFDNRTPDEIKQMVKLVPKHILTEVSGGITPDNLASYRGTGVDFISLGFLTHSVKAMDISLVVEGEKK